MGQTWGPFDKQPNILILMTDQQRTTQHYPDGWEAANLPNLTKLKQTGVTFVNSMTNTTACSPSRGVMFTGCYPTINGITQVGASVLAVGESVTLPDQNPKPITTLGLLFQDGDVVPDGVSYQVAYKGKWHLDKEFTTSLDAEQQRENAEQLAGDDAEMEQTYGFPGWTSPDFGTAMDLKKLAAPKEPTQTSQYYTLGAGLGNNDERVTKGTSYASSGAQPGDEMTTDVQNAVQFLQSYAPNGDGTNPFFLVVSLLNPHDIWVYPDNIEAAGFSLDADGKYPWQKAPFTEIGLPRSYTLKEEELNNKPTTQQGKMEPDGYYEWRPAFDKSTAKEYIQFYAYLETLTDALLGDVVDALNENPNGLADDTLIVRLADHGEMGMAQGGMREKEHQVYNETLLVPLIFSNPKLPQNQVNTHFAGLIDLMPTLATISGFDIDEMSEKYAFQGSSLDKAILDPTGETGATDRQFLFATDDSGAHIRSLIDQTSLNAKYSVYYTVETGKKGATKPVDGNPNGEASDFEYELYHFNYDKSTGSWDDEIQNLVPVNGTGTVSKDVETLWQGMHAALTDQLKANGQMPENWPNTPPT